MAEEGEPEPYHVAYRFRGERASERAYFRVQELIRRHSEDVELSAFRLMRRNDWVVAVVGEHPGAPFESRLQSILAGGQWVELDEETLRFLQQRRETQSDQGPWVEGHYRPGQGFNFDR